MEAQPFAPARAVAFDGERSRHHQTEESAGSALEGTDWRITSLSNAKRCAAQGGALDHVGTSCTRARSLFSMAAEPGLSHVLPWLDRTDLRQIRRVCNQLSEYIRERYLSLGFRMRGVWQDPAPEDANNILACWNRTRKSQATKGAVMVLATLWTTRHDSQELHTCSAQLRWAITPQSQHRTDVLMKFWVSCESGTHLQSGSAPRTLSEQQLSHIHCPGWMTNNSIT